MKKSAVLRARLLGDGPAPARAVATHYLITLEDEAIGIASTLADALRTLEMTELDGEMGVIYPKCKEYGIILLTRNKDGLANWNIKAVVGDYHVGRATPGRPPVPNPSKQVLQKIDPHLWNQYKEQLPIEKAFAIDADIEVQMIDSYTDGQDVVLFQEKPYRRFKCT